MTDSEVLKAALAYFDNGARWWNGRVSSLKYECACAWTALRQVYISDEQEDRLVGFLLAAAAIEKQRDRYKAKFRLWSWNNAPERTWPDVEAVFLAAIERAKLAEAGAST